MKTGALKLFIKIFFTALPLVLVFAWYALSTPSPSRTQLSVLADKVHRLVVGGAAGPTVIVGGESSSEMGVIPAVFETQTHEKTANISVGYGSLSQYYESLYDADLLDRTHIYVVSVRSYQINDGFIGYQPTDYEVIAQEPLGVQKIEDLWGYFSFLFQFYFEHFRVFLKTGNANSDFMDAATFNRGGYVPDPGMLSVPLPSETYSWYALVTLGGFRQAQYIDALDKLGESGDSVVLYIGPIAPAWRDALNGTKGQETEDYFARLTANEIAKYPHMHFIDFRYQNIPGLGNAQFADEVHLNDDGAHVFTSFLVQTLRAKGFLKLL